MAGGGSVTIAAAVKRVSGWRATHAVSLGYWSASFVARIRAEGHIPRLAFKVQFKMDGKIFDSEGHYVADIRASKIYDLSGKRLYDLRGQKIYKPTGELIGHLSSVAGDRRLDKSTDRLFPKYSPAGLSSWGLKAKPK